MNDYPEVVIQITTDEIRHAMAPLLEKIRDMGVQNGEMGWSLNASGELVGGVRVPGRMSYRNGETGPGFWMEAQRS
jgi:hypothetical protein